MKILLLFSSLCSIAGKNFCQSKSSAHAIQLHLELGGPGIFTSVNLDSRLTKNENGIGYRFGVGITPLAFLKHHCNRGSLNAFPLAINYLVGRSAHLIEIGAGGAALFMSGTKVFCIDSINLQETFFREETTNYWFTLIGYRYQPVHKKGFTGRAFVSPLFQKGYPVKLWGGVSIGYRF